MVVATSCSKTETARAVGIMLAKFAHKDVNRLNGFFQIAKKNVRCLSVSLRQAYRLNAPRADGDSSVPT